MDLQWEMQLARKPEDHTIPISTRSPCKQMFIVGNQATGRLQRKDRIRQNQENGLKRNDSQAKIVTTYSSSSGITLPRKPWGVDALARTPLLGRAAWALPILPPGLLLWSHSSLDSQLPQQPGMGLTPLLHILKFYWDP